MAEHMEAKQWQQKVHHDVSAHARQLETQCFYRISARVTTGCLEESLNVSVLYCSSSRFSSVNHSDVIKMTCSTNQVLLQLLVHQVLSPLQLTQRNYLIPLWLDQVRSSAKSSEPPESGPPPTTTPRYPSRNQSAPNLDLLACVVDFVLFLG